jgi:hypothetical protein
VRQLTSPAAGAMIVSARSRLSRLSRQALGLRLRGDGGVGSGPGVLDAIRDLNMGSVPGCPARLPGSRALDMATSAANMNKMRMMMGPIST